MNAPDPPRDNGPIISLKGIHKSFGRLRVLEGIDLDVERGRTTVIIGPSGCGKSVLIKHMVALLRPDKGTVHFDGERIDHLRDRHLVQVRTQFGYLFQMSALFDSMTVEENICFPLTEHTAMTRDAKRQRCREVLGLVDLEGIQAKMPAQLSGGERKRVALARAIVMRPRVIIYDEPTTGLDPIHADEINELILRLQRELGETSVVVTHDMTSASKIADRIVMLYDGQLIADGTPEEIQTSTNPTVHRFVKGRSEMRDPPGHPQTTPGDEPS